MFTLGLPLKSEGLLPLTLTMAAKVAYSSIDCHKFLRRISMLPLALSLMDAKIPFFSVCRKLSKGQGCIVYSSGHNSRQGQDEKTSPNDKTTGLTLPGISQEHECLRSRKIISEKSLQTRPEFVFSSNTLCFWPPLFAILIVHSIVRCGPVKVWKNPPVTIKSMLPRKCASWIRGL